MAEQTNNKAYHTGNPAIPDADAPRSSGRIAVKAKRTLDADAGKATRPRISGVVVSTAAVDTSDIPNANDHADEVAFKHAQEAEIRKLQEQQAAMDARAAERQKKREEEKEREAAALRAAADAELKAATARAAEKKAREAAAITAVPALEPDLPAFGFTIPDSGLSSMPFIPFTATVEPLPTAAVPATANAPRMHLPSPQSSRPPSNAPSFAAFLNATKPIPTSDAFRQMRGGASHVGVKKEFNDPKFKVVPESDDTYEEDATGKIIIDDDEQAKQIKKSITYAKKAGAKDAVAMLTAQLGQTKMNGLHAGLESNRGAIKIYDVLKSMPDKFGGGAFYACTPHCASYTVLHDLAPPFKGASDSNTAPFTRVEGLVAVDCPPTFFSCITNMYEDYKMKVTDRQVLIEERRSRSDGRVDVVCWEAFYQSLTMPDGSLRPAYADPLLIPFEFIASIFCSTINLWDLLRKIRENDGRGDRSIHLSRSIFASVDSSGTTRYFVDSDALSTWASFLHWDEYACANMWNIIYDDQKKVKVVSTKKTDKFFTTLLPTLQNLFTLLYLVIRDAKVKRQMARETLAAARAAQNGSSTAARAPAIPPAEYEGALRSKDAEIATLKARLAQVEAESKENSRKSSWAVHAMTLACQKVVTIARSAPGGCASAEQAVASVPTSISRISADPQFPWIMEQMGNCCQSCAGVRTPTGKTGGCAYQFIQSCRQQTSRVVSSPVKAEAPAPSTAAAASK